MIWLLVLVLLSAVNAITTPTPATAEPLATTIASISSKTVNFENKSGDISNSRIGTSEVHQNWQQLGPKKIDAITYGPLVGAAIRPNSKLQMQHNEQPTSSQLANLPTSASRDDTTTPYHKDYIRGKIKEPHTQSASSPDVVPMRPPSQQSLSLNSSSISYGGDENHHDLQRKSSTETKLLQKQEQPKKVYTNQFVIEVKGGEEEARRLAEKHGFIYLNHILGDYYHLEHRRLAKRSADLVDMNELDISIEEEPHVSN